jgi:hypothetical protein
MFSALPLRADVAQRSRHVRFVPDRTHASQQKVDGDLIMMRDYEPQSDAATRRMLASATGMAAALSFGCVFVGTIVSALLSRLS